MRVVRAACLRSEQNVVRFDVSIGHVFSIMQVNESLDNTFENEANDLFLILSD